MKFFNRRFVKMSAFLIALVITLACMPFGAAAVTQEEIDKLKEEVKELDKEKEGYNEQLEDLKDDMSAALERKVLIDAKIATIQEQVSAIEEIIAFYEEEIGSLEADITASEKELEKTKQAAADTYELYCERVRALEEGGNTTYWGIIFGATSFGDMLTRLDFIKEVLDYNEEIIQNYNDLCSEISAGQVALRGQLAEKQDIILANQEAKDELLSLTEELEKQREEANELILEIDNNQDQYKDLIAEIEADEAEVEALIKAKEKELEEERRKAAEEEARRKAAEQAKNNASNTPSTSNPNAKKGFIWPVSSRRVTSYFGYRSAGSTNGVGSTNHKGIDIGQVYYSTTVKASKAGRVTVATYSSSYGNYVMIDHGDGSVTVYAHISSLKVSAGQYVSQGQAIGITGSTGHSTGPHLHFEIRINGSYVDPLAYLP